ncbi:hypothetical protein ACFPYI_16080 [Halomarina salina]|uniref:Hsp20/alpha crystallin family protein n=1 Tax=Halomarina salina TaxID=1872699 RepID=A0ABD5RQW4_9EURY|nr:hypothetical protein [Halomarina salina]
MTNQLRFADGDGPLRRYDYSDRTVFAADLGAGVEADVDVVDGTVMVVQGDQQYEFDVPAGRSQAFIKNGVVTVEVSL